MRKNAPEAQAPRHRHHRRQWRDSGGYAFESQGTQTQSYTPWDATVHTSRSVGSSSTLSADAAGVALGGAVAGAGSIGRAGATG